MLTFALGVLVVYSLLTSLLVFWGFKKVTTYGVANYRLHRRLHRILGTLREVENQARDLQETMSAKRELTDILGKLVEGGMAVPSRPPAEADVMFSTADGKVVPVKPSAIQDFMRNTFAHGIKLRTLRSNPFIGPILSEDLQFVFDVERVFSTYPEYQKHADLQDRGELNPVRFMQWLYHHLVEAGENEKDPQVRVLKEWLDSRPPFPGMPPS